MLGQLEPDGSRVFPPGDMQVNTTKSGSGTNSLTSGVTGNAGVAGATPTSELGEGFTEGAADVVGFAVGFCVALGDGVIAFVLGDFVGFAVGLVLVVGDGLEATDGLTVGVGFWVTSTSGGN